MRNAGVWGQLTREVTQGAGTADKGAGTAAGRKAERQAGRRAGRGTCRRYRQDRAGRQVRLARQAGRGTYR